MFQSRKYSLRNSYPRNGMGITSIAKNNLAICSIAWQKNTCLIHYRRRRNNLIISKTPVYWKYESLTLHRFHKLYLLSFGSKRKCKLCILNLESKILFRGTIVRNIIISMVHAKISVFGLPLIFVLELHVIYFLFI